MKLSADAGRMAARPGSQNPNPQTEAFGCTPGNLDISFVQDFAPLLFALASAPLRLSGALLVSQERITTNPMSSKESLNFLLQKTLWLFLEFACQLPSVSEMNSFLLLPRDLPSLLVT